LLLFWIAVPETGASGVPVPDTGHPQRVPFPPSSARQHGEA
jgi:hypothetical protein